MDIIEVNSAESKREPSGITCKQIRGAVREVVIIRGPQMSVLAHDDMRVCDKS